MASKGTDHLLVAAIDFGTTFSGWAFLFKHQFESDPTKVFAKNWNNGTNISSKTPTTILIKPDGQTVEAFGYEAEDRFADLASENKHQPYFYFRQFKMKLFEKINLKRNMKLDEENGKQLPALNIFSIAIRCLRDDLLKECKQQIAKGEIENHDIHWVLTVPAIWNEAAKQFMREAGEKAGIAKDKLTIALEPEAASLFCKNLAIHKTIDSSGLSMDSFSPGSTYIVLDAGGGTVDITVHEVLEDDSLRELYRASGGAWGGTKVDEMFNQFLIKIFGAPIMMKFKKNHMDDYIDMFRMFEVKKREVSMDETKVFQIRLPSTLVSLFENETDERLKETIRQTPYGGRISLATGNKLKIESSVMQGFFEKSISSINEHLNVLMQNKSVQKSEFILMVGGFSESLFLHQSIRANFPKMNIIAAPESSLVVLKGAAIFGHQNDNIKERVSRFTYGYNITAAFVEGFHPESHAYINSEGEKKCKNAFRKLVEIGEMIGINERKMAKGYVNPSTDTKQSISLAFHASKTCNPAVQTDKDSIRLGKMTVDIIDSSVPKNERDFKVCGIFGQTEIKIEVLEVRTGNITSAVFDLL